MNLDPANMIGAVIISVVALIMFLIGVSQWRTKEKPVGFYNVIDPPKKEEIIDCIAWNRKHGMIWIIYGICIELGFWIGFLMPVEFFQMFFMIGGIIFPLPFMVIRHQRLEKEYKKE